MTAPTPQAVIATTQFPSVALLIRAAAPQHSAAISGNLYFS